MGLSLVRPGPDCPSIEPGGCRCRGPGQVKSSPARETPRPSLPERSSTCAGSRARLPADKLEPGSRVSRPWRSSRHRCHALVRQAAEMTRLP
jgi:hypothetical protein